MDHDARRQRMERLLQVMREHFILGCRDDITEFQRKRDEAAARGSDGEQAMYERFLEERRERLQWAEAQETAAVSR